MMTTKKKVVRKRASKPKSLIPESSGKLTLDALRAVMPKRQKRNITPSLVDKLNKLISDPEERAYFLDNLQGYAHVLQEPHVKLESYIFAVKYVSYKMMGLTNQDAWIKTFPDRYQRLIDIGKTGSHLRATVSGYNKNKIVVQVYEQAMIPVYVANADVFQQAVITQSELMTDQTVSAKVRSDAANSLMTHLKPPEMKKMDLQVDIIEDDSLRQMRGAITDLAIAQKRAIQSGGSDAERIAEARLINGESERINES
jgi:hypothetical protein